MTTSVKEIFFNWCQSTAETDGESSELSFECPSMEKFRMMEDHSFVQSTIIDQDMERVEGLLEGWTSDLKKKILVRGF